MSLPVIVEKILEARSLPLQTVTVFRDRAELKRVFDVQLHAGFNNVVINNVCASIEPDSIRVEGKGKAVIHEVQFKFDHATDTETDSPQVKKLVDDLNEIELQKATIDDLTKVYSNRLKSLDDLVTNLGQVTLTKKDAPEMLRFDSGVEETLDNFYGYHERKAVELNSKVRKSEVESRELEQKIQKLRNQIQELRVDQNYKRSICIALETVEDQAVAEIELTYQVYNASWTPSYDIRVSTIGSKPQLKLSYYGQLVQNCGEDWNEVELILSTAQPHSGSQLPLIGTLQAQFHRPQPPRAFGNVMMKRSIHTTNAIQYDAAVPEAMACSLPQYVPENHALSTTFTVKQKKTIPSDGSEHKVTIVTFDLTPILHYNCVPSKSTNVYLTASMINSSSYPLINGTASVYVDNSFSTKVDIKTVSTGEKFDCSLGIDPTVKVTYKPVHKYQQQVGMLSKTSVTMNEQKIVVKNTKQDEPIVLTIYEHVPKSTDEKIKIKLHAPEVKSNGGSSEEHQLRAPEVGTRLNDAHNLEWTVSLTPMEEREFVVKYAVEHPPTETVEYVEQF